jgi:hypothetical protein
MMLERKSAIGLKVRPVLQGYYGKNPSKVSYPELFFTRPYILHIFECGVCIGIVITSSLGSYLAHIDAGTNVCSLYYGIENYGEPTDAKIVLATEQHI